eukprot:459022-Rhodomonas_salina.2
MRRLRRARSIQPAAPCSRSSSPLVIRAAITLALSLADIPAVLPSLSSPSSPNDAALGRGGWEWCLPMVGAESATVCVASPQS